MADSVRALRELIATLTVLEGTHAHLCKGDPRSAMVWSDRTQITVRLHAPAGADNEIWVLAGAGILAQEIADSEGGFEIEPLVVAILDGRATEIFDHLHGYAQVVPQGWEVQSADGRVLGAAGMASKAPAVPAALAGPLAKA